MQLALKAPGGFAPANDNARQPRPVLAWPTGKRLAAASRHSDLVLLLDYRRLVDTAYGPAANDNMHDPAPVQGKRDTRPAEDAIDNIDLLPEDYSLSIEDLHKLSGVPWRGDAGFDESAPAVGKVVAFDVKAGARRELGGLAFIYGAHLWEYQRPGDVSPNGTAKWRRPTTVRVKHRNKPLAAPSLVPNSSGTWGLEAQIEARQELRSICDRLPASSVRLLELALGNTKAQELGEAFRKKGKAAERFGVRLFDRAIEELREAWRP